MASCLAGGRRHSRAYPLVEPPSQSTNCLGGYGIPTCRTQGPPARLLLEEWLLLCLRVLTLILLALAVAQPFVGRAASPASAVARVHRLVLLDASFSMKAEHNGNTSFDRAKEELGKLLRQAQPNDLLTLGTFTARVNWVFREPVTAAADIARQLEQLRPSDAACDLPHVLAEIAAALREARNRNRQVQAYEVWIFTDLQASNWSPPDPARAEQIARRLHQLEQEASIRIVDVSSPQTANIAVVDVSFFLTRWSQAIM